MDRRRFLLTSLAGAVVRADRSRGAEGGEDVHLGIIGAAVPVSDLVGSDPINPLTRAFVHALRELGYVQGKNLVFETFGLPRAG